MQKIMNVKNISDVHTSGFYKIRVQLEGNEKSNRTLNIDKAKTYEKVIGL